MRPYDTLVSLYFKRNASRFWVNTSLYKLCRVESVDWRALQSTLSTRHNLYKDVFTQNLEAFLLKYKDTRVS